MGRTKQFDMDQALEGALQVFWAKGYEGASLTDLLEAMGILNGSFYNTFGDKKGLFYKTVEHYGKRTQERGRVLHESENASDAIRGFFKDFYQKQKTGDLPKGCLVSKNVLQVSDPEIRSYLEENLRGMAQILQKKIQGSMDRGELESPHTSKDLAHLVFTHLQGVMRLAELNYPIASLEKQSGIFLDSLGL